MRLSELKKHDEKLYEKALVYTKKSLELLGFDDDFTAKFTDRIIVDDEEIDGIFSWSATDEGWEFWSDINSKKV